MSETVELREDLEEAWPWVVRLRMLADSRPLLADLIAAGVLDLLTALPLVGHEHRWWVWLLDQALVLPLTYRRKRPVGTFVLVSAIAFVQWLSGVPLAADAALLAALYTVAAHESRSKALLAAATLEVGVVLASVRFAPADESELYSIIFLTGMVAAALFGGTTLRTRRAYLAGLVERARQQEIERRNEAVLAVTRERTRIAREMHDIVAHSLSVMIALADGAARSNASDPAQAAEAMTTVSGTGRQALSEMRRLLGVLREDEQPIGLAPQPGLGQLPDLAERVRLVGPDVALTVAGTPRRLPPTEDATAYRIVQESLTNVVKHAVGATRVDIGVHWRDDALWLRIADDGQAAAAATSTGHGLVGMAERAAVFDGSVTAGPRPEGGWAVDAVLPIGAT